MLSRFISIGSANILVNTIFEYFSSTPNWAYVRGVSINTIFILMLLYYELKKEGK